MNDSLFALEKLLKSILIPTKVKDINKTGKINLETFLPELGFGMLDGLTTYEKGISTLCTTSFIFSDYFKKQGYKIDNISKSQIEDIFTNAFASDYTITGIQSFKINEKENIKTYGMISIDGQDIGPFKPNTLYVLASIEDNIYLIRKSINNELIGLEKCDAIWSNTDRESEDKTWRRYCECYKQEFTNRNIEPLAICFINNVWIVIANCQLRDEVREFRLDRINKLITTTEYFETENNFELQEYFKSFQT